MPGLDDYLAMHALGVGCIQPLQQALDATLQNRFGTTHEIGCIQPLQQALDATLQNRFGTTHEIGCIQPLQQALDATR